MKKIFLSLIYFFIFSTVFSQKTNTDTIKPPSVYENIHAIKIASDSLSTSFVIFIKKEVKLHKHNTHTENILVLEGEGEMRLGVKKFNIKKGDHVFIPKGTPHSVKVKSKKAMKVLSIQSPNFDGKDREMIIE